MDFRKLISPRSQAAIAEKHAKLMAFQALDRREMARALMENVRKMQQSPYLSKDQRYSYDEWGIYRVMPELAVALDPEFLREPQELPADDERKDRITYLHGEGPDKLRHAVQSILSQASYSRLTSREDLETANMAELTIGQPYSMFSVAADTVFPGIAAKRAEPDEREPLAGQYLISVGKLGHHRVLEYSEDRALLDRIFDVAVAIERGTEVSDEDLAIKNDLTRNRFYMNVVSMQIQAFDGEVLREEKLEASAEAELAELGA